MALDDEQRAREIADTEQLLEVLRHPGWDGSLMRLFHLWLAEATAKTTDVDLALGQRDKASGLAEAWGKMVQLKDEMLARYQELRESEQLEQAAGSRAEETVGAKAADQWYEKNEQ